MRVISFLLVSVIFLSGCAGSPETKPTPAVSTATAPGRLQDGEYDNTSDLLKYITDQDIKRVTDATVFIRTRMKVRDLERKVAELDGGGMGIILSHRGENYILTAAHVVDPFLVPEEVEGLEKIEIAVFLDKEDSPLVVKLEQVFASKDLENEPDAALLRVPKGAKVRPFPYQIGDSGKLSEGNLVFMIGNRHNEEKKIKSTRIGHEVSDPLFSRRNREDLFLMRQVEFHPGESGAPIIALMDGRYQLVGLAVQFQEKLRLGYAVKINQALEFIKKRTGIDLR